MNQHQSQSEFLDSKIVRVKTLWRRSGKSLPLRAFVRSLAAGDVEDSTREDIKLALEWMIKKGMKKQELVK